MEQDVVIADDHQLIVDSLRAIFAGMDAVRVVAVAHNGIETLAAVRHFQPALLTLDVAMPLSGGADIFADVRRWSPETRIAIVTGLTSRRMHLDWRAAGVDGLLLKSSAPETFRQAFAALLRNERYIDPAVDSLVGEETCMARLTLRERQVLNLLAAGNTNSQIAQRLAVSAKTIDNHRTNLMAKLGVHSLAELLAYALREGLLDRHHQE
jgi:DNA-binding NarL/FixJ family response regulator